MSLFKKSFKKEYFPLAIAIMLTGIGAGFFSFTFHKSVQFLSRYLGTNTVFNPKSAIFSLLALLTSYLLTKLLFKDTNGSGIPQVKLALVALKGRMPRRMPFGKFLTSLSTLASGLSFGSEGPLVSISAAWAHLVSYLLRVNRQLMKVLVTAGATAGLSAAFNTPIAAVVFTVEEILGQLNTKYLGPIIIVSVLASVTSYNLFGGTSTFVNVHYKLHEEWHLILYTFLGLTMSLVGYLWEHSVIFFKKIKSNIPTNFDFVFIVFVWIAVCLCSQFSDTILGPGASTINNFLLGNIHFSLLFVLILFLMKFLLSASSYSTGLSGGLFMPVLFLGATGGVLFALFLQQIGIEQIDIGAFALLGMTSLLVAIIRIPFTAFVMMFEMTRDYDLILPLMVSSIASFLVSSVICPESIYELVAEYEGVHLPSPTENEALDEMTIEHCMVTEVKTLPWDAKIKDYVEEIERDNFGGYPILSGKKLAGLANSDVLLRKYKEDPEAKIHEVTKRSFIRIYPDQSLLVAFDKMRRFEIGRLPVVSRFNDKTLIGIITPEDIVNFLYLSKNEKVDSSPS